MKTTVSTQGSRATLSMCSDKLSSCSRCYIATSDMPEEPTDALNEAAKCLKISFLTIIHIVSIPLQKERNRVLRNVSENRSAPLQRQQYRAWYSLR